MINVVFVCLGNICRSPMAEFVMRDLCAKKGLSDNFNISSAATSDEELGNSVHRGTVRKLSEHGISCNGKHAELLSCADIENSDYILVMDGSNLRDIEYIMKRRWDKFYLENKGKLHMLLEYAGRTDNIADPWYTGNFEDTWNDVYSGVSAFLNYLIKEKLC